MPSIIPHTNIAPNTIELVTNTTGRDVAVDGAVAREDAVDRLEDVDLAALRPGGAMPDRVAEHPEGRPEALLVGLRVVAEADLGFDHGPLAIRGREYIFGLEARRGPAAVVQGDDL